MYIKSAKQEKREEKKKILLELALNDAKAAITADPTWLLGYHTKALTLAELDRKLEALAAAATFKHLSLGRDVCEVTQQYGGFQVYTVQSLVQLYSVFERAKELEEENKIILIKEGNYVLDRSLKLSQQTVIVGQGKVTVSCKVGASFPFSRAFHVENIEIIGDSDHVKEFQDSNQNDIPSNRRCLRCEQ